MKTLKDFTEKEMEAVEEQMRVCVPTPYQI